MVTVPLTVPRVDAALETPQDEDWYLLYPQGVRQIGVLATLKTPCSSSDGTVHIDLLDGDGSTLPIVSLRLGYDFTNSKVPLTTATASFTSEIGHRYLLHVTESSCDGVGYSLALAPTGALGRRIAPTQACDAANVIRRRTSYNLRRLRATRRHAHGARRKKLGAKIQLQSQRLTQARADAARACARVPLTGYLWE
jgi:hypothetical protein